MLMVTKKKKQNSNSYWMKFGGSIRKMNFGGLGFDSGGSGSWAGGTEPLYTGQQRQHTLNGSTISLFNPQYIPGHQRGGSSNSSNEGDFVYRNKPKTKYAFKSVKNKKAFTEVQRCLDAAIAVIESEKITA